MKHISTQRGAAVITSVILLLGLSLILTSAASRLVLGEASRSETYIDSQERYRVAESAAEDVVYRLKKGYSVSPEETVLVGSADATVGVTSSSGIHTVRSRSIQPRATRAVELSLYQGEGVDFFYGIQVGSLGVTMANNSTVRGNVFTNGSLVGGNGSAITGSAFTVGTISTPNPAVAGQTQTGVEPIALPEFDVEYWKAAANVNNDPYIGSITYSGLGNVLGPRKIEGDVTITGSGRLTVQGPIHITGTLTLDNSAVLALDNSFGSLGATVLVEGKIIIRNNSSVLATNATPKGYILLISTQTGVAIELNNNAISQTLAYAYNGIVDVQNNGKALAIVAQGMTIAPNAIIDYDIGLQDSRFSEGPSGGWNIQSWQEAE